MTSVRSPSPFTNAWDQSHTAPIERHLLHHFIFKVATVLINVDGPSNPLRSVIIPRAVTSPTLMNALYATAALHAFAGNHDSEFRIASLVYYNRSVSALHELISKKTQADIEIQLLTAVLLCKYEIISGGVSTWLSHLQGIRKMFDMFQENITLLAPDTVAYVQSL
jgi:hypothetical protein